MSILNKGSKLYSIFLNLCPKCHEGKFWKTVNPFKNILLKNSESSISCDKCMIKYELEIGFWYGAMYISYAIGVALMLLLWGGLILCFPLMDITILISLVVVGILIFCPINYHLSRLIWVNIFIKYQGDVN